MSKIKLVCEKCKKSFYRYYGEHNRNAKKGLKTYCSKKCTGNINNIPIEKRNKSTAHLLEINRLDEYSPFRYHLRNCRNRMRYRSGKHSYKGIDIDLKYLKTIWDEQKGICPLTGWKMENMKSHSDKIDLTPKRASLDRIDNSKGLGTVEPKSG